MNNEIRLARIQFLADRKSEIEKVLLAFSRQTAWPEVFAELMSPVPLLKSAARECQLEIEYLQGVEVTS